MGTGEDPKAPASPGAEATVECPSCARLIARKAWTCPTCGWRRPMPFAMKVAILLAASLVLAWVFVWLLNHVHA